MREKIFICGHWFSGSGAVVDFVKGNEGFKSFGYDYSETFFVGGNGLMQVARYLKNHNYKKVDAVIAAFLMQVNGLLGGIAYNKRSREHLNYLNGNHLLNVASFCQDVFRLKGEESDSIVASLLDDVINLLPGVLPDDKIIFNNDPPLHHGYDIREIVESFPGSKVCAVFRDPRDSYSSLKKRNLVGKEGLEKWAGATSDVLENLLGLQKSENIKIVCFEDFCNDSSVRKSVSAWLGDHSEDSSIFDWEMSSKNIGVYNQYLDYYEIDFIEKGLLPVYFKTKKTFCF
ncbi:MAG: hypothetical protein ACQEUG_10695 [Pseudomonadota bacterium]